MKSKFRILFLLPFLMAFQCEEDEIQCGVEFTNNYSVNVEDIKETYASGETIWFKGEVSSELFDSCSNQSEVVFDNNIFVTGFFVLKLTNDLANRNAEVVENYTVTYSIGDSFSSIYCAEFVHFTPDLSENSLSYNYRIGVSINEPGDYSIVAAFQNNFDNIQQDNNAEIFEAYNSLDNVIKFVSCDAEYTRNGTDGQYFFRVN